MILSPETQKANLQRDGRELMLKRDATIEPGGDGALKRVARNSMTLRERAADVLRQAIIDNQLPPGSHLKERALCDMLGVSRTSVREALRHLESEHLIVTVPHRGPTVVTLTTDDARDLYKVRSALEGLVGELFATHASDAEIAELRRIAALISNSARRGEPEVTLSIVADFYKVLFDGSKNPVCAQFIQSLNARISMFRRVSLASEGRVETMINEVQNIVDAAAARDPDALRKACIEHVEGACSAVMKQLSEQ
jgi:DNA-binding GntR family transcriptional regulator